MEKIVHNFDKYRRDLIPARTAEIKRLRAAKLSYQKIGELFGISRQRVHQILKAEKFSTSNFAKITESVESLAEFLCGFYEEAFSDGFNRNDRYMPKKDRVKWLLKESEVSQ